MPARAAAATRALFGYRPPFPARDTPFAGAGFAGLDEVSKIGFVAGPVADETQSGQGSLNQPPPGRTLACHHGVVGLRMRAYQHGIDDAGRLQSQVRPSAEMGHGAAGRCGSLTASFSWPAPAGQPGHQRGDERVAYAGGVNFRAARQGRYHGPARPYDRAPVPPGGQRRAVPQQFPARGYGISAAVHRLAGEQFGFAGVGADDVGGAQQGGAGNRALVPRRAPPGLRPGGLLARLPKPRSLAAGAG